jgi:hypothetical protein
MGLSIKKSKGYDEDNELRVSLKKAEEANICMLFVAKTDYWDGQCIYIGGANSIGRPFPSVNNGPVDFIIDGYVQSPVLKDKYGQSDRDLYENDAVAVAVACGFASLLLCLGGFYNLKWRERIPRLLRKAFTSLSDDPSGRHESGIHIWPFLRRMEALLEHGGDDGVGLQKLEQELEFLKYGVEY